MMAEGILSKISVDISDSILATGMDRENVWARKAVMIPRMLAL